MTKLKLILIFIFVFYPVSAWSNCTIKMVFKLGDKYPLMNAAPDNSGIFQDLYTEASHRIGCELSITRLPKQRAHQGLEQGRFDFYPAASFSTQRSRYLIYLDNGLTTSEYGISSKGVPTITQLSQLKKVPSLIWLLETNSSKDEVASNLGIAAQKVKYLNIEKVIEFVNKRRSYQYFYVADKEILDSFIAKNDLSNLNTFGLKIHRHCCGQQQPMYMGVSRYSPSIREQLNDDFDPTLNASPQNQVTTVKANSLIEQFYQALSELKKEGVTDTIYKKWYAQLEDTN
ncbi:hypothetical protein HR060_09560 [Catenovulum sp. SM1970]|uniref:transporter substrate-binding domain-containing protein n=1 Tax=Marinifaba aquimaris TaxID=2741323 RepID=UPI001574E2D1|nr:hypothetical protein [Marinifaba aquimaris]NTS77119.1 hypothetical protein [Marinifaba aquimaris]